VIELIQKVVTVKREEIASMLWATFYGFCIFVAYYMLRPVRDEISSADRGNLQILWTAVFLVMLVAVPLYSWLVSKTTRGKFIPIANRFFISNILVFYAALRLLPDSARIWVDRAFYVWLSVFALFVVTVFWGFLADLFHSEQGKRIFGFIAMGSSVGGIVGGLITQTIVTQVEVFTLLLIACVPLEVASWVAKILDRKFGQQGEGAEKAEQKVEGDAFSGIKVVLQSPYLARIAGYIALMTFASTILYFELSLHIREAFEIDRTARTVLYARIDIAVNIVTILFQTVVTTRLIKYLGLGLSLAIVPGIALIGSFGLAAAPVLPVLIILQVAYTSCRHGIAKPTREVLFTVVSREEKYKSKAFIDAAVYRGGDLVSGWTHTGLMALGMSTAAIALAVAPVAAIWVGLGLWLGKKQEEMAD
jgi:AAA family ATP:ADP antiporter